MKKSTLWSLLILALALATLAGCSGGSSSGGGGGTTSQPATAVVTLSTAGSITAPTVITGYDVTVTLPVGVTVQSSTPPQTDANVVIATGAATGSQVIGVYTAPTGTNPVIPGKVRILVANGAGFNTGAFATLICNITPGNSPQASDFLLPLFSASGFNTSSHSTVPSNLMPLSVSKSVVIN